MRYKKQILVTLSLVIAVALTQCKKNHDDPYMQNPALVAEGKKSFAMIHWVMKNFGVAFYISTKLLKVQETAATAQV